MLTNASVLSLASLGVWVTFAIGGQHRPGRFAMIGGYTTAILSTRYGLSWWLCLPLSALVSAAVGIVIGWPILRLKGVYFAMVTLSLTEAVRLAFLSGGEFTQGASGIVDRSRGPPASTARSRSTSWRPSSWSWVSSRSGASPTAAWAGCFARFDRTSWPGFVGIDIARYRVIAFAFCCALRRRRRRVLRGLPPEHLSSELHRHQLDQLRLLSCFLADFFFSAFRCRADRRRLPPGRGL